MPDSTAPTPPRTAVHPAARSAITRGYPRSSDRRHDHRHGRHSLPPRRPRNPSTPANAPPLLHTHTLVDLHHRSHTPHNHPELPPPPTPSRPPRPLTASLTLPYHRSPAALDCDQPTTSQPPAAPTRKHPRLPILLLWLLLDAAVVGCCCCCGCYLMLLSLIWLMLLLLAAAVAVADAVTDVADVAVADAAVADTAAAAVADAVIAATRTLTESFVHVFSAPESLGFSPLFGTHLKDLELRSRSVLRRTLLQFLELESLL